MMVNLRSAIGNGNQFLAKTSLIGIAVATTALPGVASAQSGNQAQASGSGLSDIVVTAQRREENLQEVPISVTAIGGESLEATGISDTLNLPQVVPSVQMTRSGPSNIFFIRGIGNTSGGTGEEGANAFYIDGVYLADLQQANTEFNNIERVEVLKGPQGTLFGRNASGGLVNIITKEPGDVFELNGKFGYGNYDTIRGQVYVAGPLSETVSMDLALTGRDQNDGYGENVVDGKDSMLGWQWGARSKLVFRPSDRAKLVLAGDYWKSKDDFSNGFTIIEGALGAFGNPFVGDHNKNTTNPTNAILEVWGTSLTGEFDFDFATLTSITAYRKLDAISNVDADYSPLVYVELHIPSESKTFQQELRLASNDSGPLSWQVGAFLFHSKGGVYNQELRGIPFGGATSGFDLTSVMKTESYAVFGEVSYDITPTTHITGGIRYTDETRKLRAEQFVNANGVIGAQVLDKRDKISFDEVTWRAAIRQDITDDVNIYASYNRGFKSGLWALQSPAGDPVGPQTTDAFEVGLKSELFDRMLRINLAGYHYKIKGYQIRAAPVASSPILLNAATAKVDGFEGDFVLAPVPRLQITGNFNWLKARFKSFPGAIFTYPNPAAACDPLRGPDPSMTTGPITGGNATCIGDASGNRLPLAPKFTLGFGISYSIPLEKESELIFNANFSHNSGYFFEQDNRLRQPDFQLLNGSIEYRFTEKMGIEVWAKNLTNEKYWTTKLGSGFGDHGELRPPRTYGVNVVFDF
jgi:iron complex outermembrane receptor protein